MSASSLACVEGENGGGGEGTGGEMEKGDRVSCCFKLGFSNGAVVGRCLSSNPLTDPQFDMPICRDDGETPSAACGAVLACPAIGTASENLPAWTSAPGGTTLTSCTLDSAEVEQTNACRSSITPAPGDLTLDTGYSGAFQGSGGTAGSITLSINGVSRKPAYTMPVVFDRVTSGSSCTLRLRTLAIKPTSQPVYGAYSLTSGFAFLPASVSTSINCSTGAFSFAPNSVVLMTDWRQRRTSSGIVSHASASLLNSSALSGTLNLTTNTLTFNGTFTGSIGGSSASLGLASVQGSVVAL